MLDLPKHKDVIMAGYLLNVGYLALLVLCSPLLLYAAVCKGKYRAGFAAKFLGRVPIRSGHRSCVWFHAVSVGEVQLVAPIVAKLRERLPELQIVISTTTHTGYAVAKRKYDCHTVFYCPLDFTWSTAAAMRRIRPSVVVLAELELWPNLVRAARRYGSKVAVVNGRLSDHSFRGYLRIRPVVSRLLKSINLVAAQNQTYADRFLRLGAEPAAVHVTGSVKFDGAQSDRANPRTAALRELAGIAAEDVVFLAGSTQHPEESIALESFLAAKETDRRLRLILVPRHPERFEEVARLLEQSGELWQRRTALDPTNVGRGERRILLVDTVGELGDWWGAAAIGFVGGSLGSRGGQNMIEPAAYGAAVCFGPNTKNFRDVVASLLAHDAAKVVRDKSELTEFVHRCLGERDFAAGLGRRAAKLAAGSCGATDATVSLLMNLVAKESGSEGLDAPLRAA